MGSAAARLDAVKAAAEHIRAAHHQLTVLPERGEDGHRAVVIEAHAHVGAARKFFDDYDHAGAEAAAKAYLPADMLHRARECVQLACEAIDEMPEDEGEDRARCIGDAAVYTREADQHFDNYRDALGSDDEPPPEADEDPETRRASARAIAAVTRVGFARSE